MKKYKLFFFNDNNRLWAIDSEYEPNITIWQDDRGDLANSFLPRYKKKRRASLLVDIGDRIKRTPDKRLLYSLRSKSRG